MSRTKLPGWAQAVACAILLAYPCGIGRAASARENAARAAIHPVRTMAELRTWLARVPQTNQFPPDFAETLRAQAGLFTLEMTTAPGCLPCGDLWTRLSAFGRAYGWQVRVIAPNEALMRSGRLGLPWIGHPVLWVRPTRDESRTIPVAIGTDHDVNLHRNIYLAVKMLGGVRPAVGLRAMSKFTGIVAPGGARSSITQQKRN